MVQGRSFYYHHPSYDVKLLPSIGGRIHRTLRSGLATSGRTHITGRIKCRNLILCLQLSSNKKKYTRVFLVDKTARTKETVVALLNDQMIEASTQSNSSRTATCRESRQRSPRPLVWSLQSKDRPNGTSKMMESSELENYEMAAL